MCGTPLAKGSDALHDPTAKTVRCLECPRNGLAVRDDPIDEGVAGGSAWREYERRKAKREARIKGIFGDHLGGVILVLGREPQSTRAWAKGAAGVAFAAEYPDACRAVPALREWIPT